MRNKQFWLQRLYEIDDDCAEADRFTWTLNGLTALSTKQLRAIVLHLRAIHRILKGQS